MQTNIPKILYKAIFLIVIVHKYYFLGTDLAQSILRGELSRLSMIYTIKINI